MLLLGRKKGQCVRVGNGGFRLSYIYEYTVRLNLWYPPAPSKHGGSDIEYETRDVVIGGDTVADVRELSAVLHLHAIGRRTDHATIGINASRNVEILRAELMTPEQLDLFIPAQMQS